METMKKQSVNMLAGGGGSSLTGNINVTDRQPMQLSNRLARLCHSGLDPESYQRNGREFNAGKILNQVQDDRIGITRAAFTMAEILLSLTIIGVVAAITLPSLTGNINERTWNTQKKALHARMSQAISLMPSLNGYGTATEGTDSAGSKVLIVDNVAETFVTAGLAKVLKINNICDSEHLTDCGLPKQLTTMVGSNRSFPTTNRRLSGPMVSSIELSTGSVAFSAPDYKAAAFETVNGESIAIYYNPNCQSAMGETERYFVQDKLCMVGLYDLNGNKGPNTIGKDMGILAALYPVDSVVVLPLPTFISYERSDLESSRRYCHNISGENENRLPNREEAAVMAIMREYYVNFSASSGNFWTSIATGPSKGWRQGFGGDIADQPKTLEASHAWCVKR